MNACALLVGISIVDTSAGVAVALSHSRVVKAQYQLQVLVSTLLKLVTDGRVVTGIQKEMWPVQSPWRMITH